MRPGKPGNEAGFKRRSPAAFRSRLFWCLLTALVVRFLSREANFLGPNLQRRRLPFRSAGNALGSGRPPFEEPLNPKVEVVEVKSWDATKVVLITSFSVILSTLLFSNLFGDELMMNNSNCQFRYFSKVGKLLTIFQVWFVSCWRWVFLVTSR